MIVRSYLLCLLCGLGLAPGAFVRAAGQPSFEQHVAPLLGRYCIRCHTGSKARGGLNLEPLQQEKAARASRKVWERVDDMLRAGDMPPAGKPRPAPAELDALHGWLDAVVFQIDCNLPRDPGRVTLRRLNCVEYNNTIRDLFGVDFQPARDFPSDDVGYGFDNIGDILFLPPLLLEKYMQAGEQIVRKAWLSPEARKRILIRAPANEPSVREILQAFVARAYRRPTRPQEIDRLLRLVDLARKNGETYEKGLQIALQAVLVSPHFLFRVELDRGPGKSPAISPVSDFQLASRLSYFLWSSMPDEELFALAQKKKLHDPAILEAQVRRMLRDTKAHSLVDSFAVQWLQLRKLRTCTPNPAQFPTFDESLRQAMLQETEQFFEHIVREDRSVLELLDADYTFVNERLARHYGIPGVQGDAFRRVSLAGSPRGGLLTQASILTVTSNPTRTSPVKRGKWILDNILGTPPPPPPPDVPELKETELKGTLRQQMEQHRANALCASCHERMDPLGFGFENFDAVGAWREQDGKHPVDASGTLPGGRSFKGPVELREILKEKKDAFVHCLADRLLTYALGRGTERFDRCTLDDICRGTARDGYRFSRLVLEIVQSDPFLKRKGK